MSRRLALAGALAVTSCSHPHHAPPRNVTAAADPHMSLPATTTVSSTVPAADRRAPSPHASRNAARPRIPAATAGPNPGAGSTNTAQASWYARGRVTANGDPFNPDQLTFANRTMRFGTKLRFCHDGRCVDATCTDRGPAAYTGRDFDLSRAAFAAIAPLGAGVITVTWQAAA